MSHELNIENGKASMMYVGEKPWHNLGTELPNPATAEEAIKAANLDWNVVKKPLFASERNVSVPLENKYAIVREDHWGTESCRPFGIVSTEYTPLQNREAFQFFDPIVGQNAAVYHTAGALGNGERIWILAKLPEKIRVAGDDITDQYLLLSNTHDGTTSVQVRFTPVRVVCQNTLTMALSQRGRTVNVPHYRDVHQRLTDADKLLGIIRSEYEEISAEFQAMAKRTLVDNEFKKFVNAVFPDPEEPAEGGDSETFEKHRRIARRNREVTERLFETGKGNSMPGVKGSLWAAYNAVVEYVDQCITTFGSSQKITEKMQRRHLNAIWYGRGYHTKCRAFSKAKEIISE